MASLKDREVINMRFICIDCQFNYKLWQNKVTAFSSERFNATELDALLNEIKNDGSSIVVLYAMHMMEFKFGAFLEKIKHKVTVK
jgi:hypothetical protein